MATGRRRVASGVLLMAVIAVLAALSAFDLFEQDIFWQIRAGDEILHGPGLQHVDSWSLTAQGRPWINFEWLSTVLLRTVYGLGGTRALIALRVALAVALLGAAALIVRRSVARERWLTTTLLLLPLVYVTVAFKIEVRSDTFVFLVYAGLLLLWSSALPERAKLVGSLALTILATNLHGGTAPFVALTALPFIWSIPASGPRRLAWSAAHVGALLVNPYGWRIVPILWEHIAYAHYNKLDNFDHAPLSFSQFSLLNFGIAAWTWIPLAAAGWIGFWLSRRAELKARRPASLVAAAIGVGLTAMAVTRMRAFPYHLLFFLPFVATLVERGLAIGARRRFVRWASLIVAGAVGAWLVVLHVRFFSVSYGGEISREAFPIGSAAFIARARPRPNLFHTYGYGGYFVWALRDYRTFVDTRETMFRHMQSVMLEAQRSPAYAARVWDAYAIDTAVIPTPPTRYIEGVGFEDAIATLFSPDEWAIVYFDDISTVVVRRIPEHAAIIRDNEFLLLRPEIPANHYVVSKARNTDDDARFRAELDRCEKNEPENIHCAIARSAMARLWTGERGLESARDKLVALSHRGNRNVPFLIELSAVLRATGEMKRADAVERRIASLTDDS